MVKLMIFFRVKTHGRAKICANSSEKAVSELELYQFCLALELFQVIVGVFCVLGPAQVRDFGAQLLCVQDLMVFDIDQNDFAAIVA